MNIDLFKKHNKLVIAQEYIKGIKNDLIEIFNSTQLEDIDIIFNTNIDLQLIGTKEQYYHYLSTIFPQSIVKGIMYHETNAEFDTFSLDFVGQNTNNKNKAIFFAPNQNKIPFYGNKCIKALVNITGKINEEEIKHKISQDFTLVKEHIEEFNTLNMDEVEDFLCSEHNTTNKRLEDYLKDTGTTGIQYPENGIVRVFDVQQIHILGSQCDILGFSNYIKNNNM